MNEPFQEQEWEKKTADIYQVFNNMPEVTVSSIVGNNGSGKSSLIDIMFRMINNLAFVLLDRDKDQNHYNASEEAARPGRELNYAYGLWASLYFETFGNIGRITCSGDEMEYAYRDEKNGLVVFSK